MVIDVWSELDESGFVVLPGAVAAGRMTALRNAYSDAMASASSDDRRVGSTSTKVTDFVNRGAEFDELYVFPPLLDACRRLIAGQFKLSSLLGRTLRPGSAAQELHVDVQRDSADWPLVGFIVMVDEFRHDNGATRFVPGSQRWPRTPEDVMPERRDDYDGQILACAPAGSLLIFNGSVWHGHSANRSDQPRRSIQGAFIPRDGHAATDFAARMRPETRARLGPRALEVLGL